MHLMTVQRVQTQPQVAALGICFFIFYESSATKKSTCFVVLGHRLSLKETRGVSS